MAPLPHAAPSLSMFSLLKINPSLSLARLATTLRSHRPLSSQLALPIGINFCALLAVIVLQRRWLRLP